MKHIYFDLGNCSSGDTVEVVLHGTEANVVLLDDSNYNNYKNGKGFHHFGGHYKSSPVLIKIPHDGHWNLAVDLGGGIGEVKASAIVIKATH